MESKPDVKAFYGKILANIEEEEDAAEDYLLLADEADKLGLDWLAEQLRAIAKDEKKHHEILETFHQRVKNAGISTLT